MTDYLIQIRNSDGFLMKSYKIDAKHPARPTPPPPPDITQVIMTNENSFYEIEADFNQYTSGLSFSYDEQAGTISCTGAKTETWPIN